MRKSDARKLRPGQRIRFGDSMWSRKCDHNWYEGKVLFVTAQGGIRVQTASGDQWVPYHHVLRKVQDHDFTLDPVGEQGGEADEVVDLVPSAQPKRGPDWCLPHL